MINALSKKDREEEKANHERRMTPDSDYYSQEQLLWLHHEEEIKRPVLSELRWFSEEYLQSKYGDTPVEVG